MKQKREPKPRRIEQMVEEMLKEVATKQKRMKRLEQLTTTPTAYPVYSRTETTN